MNAVADWIQGRGYAWRMALRSGAHSSELSATTNVQGCRLTADGAIRAVSMMRVMVSRVTGRDVKRRHERRCAARSRKAS